MLKMEITIDREGQGIGIIGIHAKGSMPEIAADVEIAVTQIVTGLCKQIPERETAAARALFLIAAVEGAKKALSE